MTTTASKTAEPATDDLARIRDVSSKLAAGTNVALLAQELQGDYQLEPVEAVRLIETARRAQSRPSAAKRAISWAAQKAVGLLAFLVGAAIAKYYLSTFLLLVGAVVLYVGIRWVLSKVLSPDQTKDAQRAKGRLYLVVSGRSA